MVSVRTVPVTSDRTRLAVGGLVDGELPSRLDSPKPVSHELVESLQSSTEAAPISPVIINPFSRTPSFADDPELAPLTAPLGLMDLGENNVPLVRVAVSRQNLEAVDTPAALQAISDVPPGIYRLLCVGPPDIALGEDTGLVIVPFEKLDHVPERPPLEIRIVEADVPEEGKCVPQLDLGKLLPSDEVLIIDNHLIHSDIGHTQVCQTEEELFELVESFGCPGVVLPKNDNGTHVESGFHALLDIVHRQLCSGLDSFLPEELGVPPTEVKPRRVAVDTYTNMCTVLLEQFNVLILNQETVRLDTGLPVQLDRVCYESFEVLDFYKERLAAMDTGGVPFLPVLFLYLETFLSEGLADSLYVVATRRVLCSYLSFIARGTQPVTLQKLYA